MSLPEDYEDYIAQCTCMDMQFSVLESLAFCGIWDYNEKRRLWVVYDIEHQNRSDPSNPAHKRLQGLIAIYGAVCFRKEDPELLTMTIKDYVSEYPGAQYNPTVKAVLQVLGMNKGGEEQ